MDSFSLSYSWQYCSYKLRYVMGIKMEKKNKVTSQESREKERNEKEKDQAKDKINLDYDWNSEYGDGDIPDIDK